MAQKNLFLAYDGSINADWVSRYAMLMATHTTSKKITLLHVLDGVKPLEKIERAITRMKNECQAHALDFESHSLRLDKNVTTTLIKAIPAGEEHYCICGMRTASMGKGFLTGTISEQLLRCKRFNVLAVRVVNPGLLGCPGDVLFPLAGHPQGFQAAMPFFMMLSPFIHKLHILRIMDIAPLWFRYMSDSTANKQLSKGIEYVKKVIGEIQEKTADEDLHLDMSVVLSDDWIKEILLQAGKLRTKMLLLGASNRSLPSRFFYGNRLEQILRKSPCDVGIYRKI